jgi:hypothetical protein
MAGLAEAPAWVLGARLAEAPADGEMPRAGLAGDALAGAALACAALACAALACADALPWCDGAVITA